MKPAVSGGRLDARPTAPSDEEEHFGDRPTRDAVRAPPAVPLCKQRFPPLMPLHRTGRRSREVATAPHDDASAEPGAHS